VVLERRIAELEARVRELERLLSEAVRGTKRQAAPFSKGAPASNPQKSGRKRTSTGAHALEVLASLFSSCRQNAIDALTLLSNLLRALRPLRLATV
jgi:hypothetical protein